jgi:hypothetical protein
MYLMIMIINPARLPQPCLALPRLFSPYLLSCLVLPYLFIYFCFVCQGDEGEIGRKGEGGIAGEPVSNWLTITRRA